MKCRLIAAAVAVVLALVGTGAMAQTHKGEATLGPKIGYISENRSATAALAFTYSFSDHFRVAPEIGYVFRHHDHDALTADLNAHFPLSIGLPRAALYPLGGLHFSAWSMHSPAESDGKDVSTRVNRLGANLGAGMSFCCNNTLMLIIEAKYCFIKDYSSIQVGMGLQYIF